MASYVFSCIFVSLSVVSLVLGEPTQVHIAVGHDAATSVTVSMVTAENEVGQVHIRKDGTGDVRVVNGTTPLNYTTTSISTGRTYSSDFIHHIDVIGLEPETTYLYSVGLQKTYQNGFYPLGEFNFTTAPSVGFFPGYAHDQPLTFAVIGDLGQTSDSASTVDHILAEPDIAAVLHAGDLAYADCKDTRWDSWSQMVQPAASRLPWMVCPGNHEIETDKLTGATFTAFEARFRMPAVAQAVQAPSPTEGECTPSEFMGVYDYGNSFFSFDYGPAHIIFMNSYTNASAGSAQYGWVVSDLSTVNRVKTPWVFVLFHCPWYNSDNDHQDEFQAVSMQAALEPVFLNYRVNAVFTGHVHAYERTHPLVLDGVVDVSRGIVYVVVGDGGNREGHADDYNTPPPDWSAYRNGSAFGHGRLTLYNASVALWEWRRDIDPVSVTQDSTFLLNP